MVTERKIIDHVSGWMTMYDDGCVERTFTGPQQFKFMSDPVAPHANFVDGVAVHDISINDDSNLRVRVYVPEVLDTHTTKLPIILQFHGGGFCISQADWFMYYNIYSRLAREAGVVIVSPFLRLAPEHRLPAAIDDAYNTLLWLRDLAEQKTNQSLGTNQDMQDWLSTKGDFTRVFLIGDSSGGNIVHQVAKKASGENLHPLKLAGAIPVHPGFLRPVKSKSEMEKAESPFLTLDMLYKFLNLALPEGSTRDHPITCPMEDDSLESLNLPPYLLCVAEEDLVIATNMEFYEALKKSGKNVELSVSNGVGHSFYLNKVAIDFDPVTSEQTRKLIEAIVKFVHSRI